MLKLFPGMVMFKLFSDFKTLHSTSQDTKYQPTKTGFDVVYTAQAQVLRSVLLHLFPM